MKKKILCIGVVLFLVIITICYNNSVVIMSDDKSEAIIGIIDGQLSMAYNDSSDVIYSNLKSEKTTHGDEIVQFVKNYTPNTKIFYYDASNDNGTVTSDGLIDALNWMEKKGVKFINISMSSNTYNLCIDELLIENKNTYKVFASYNNNEESDDYPAMYEATVGVGKKNRIPFKDSDISYRSNNLFLISNGIRKYTGNSFLTVVETINASKE